MVKGNRPVIVLTGSIQGRPDLVTIAPLSTLEPNPVQSYHYKIPKQSMPMLGNFQDKDSWLKGDMIYTVGLHRLSLIRLGKRRADGKRLYFIKTLCADHMKRIYQCVLHGLNLKKLALSIYGI